MGAFDGAVLMRDASIVADWRHAIMAAQFLVAIGQAKRSKETQPVS